MWTIILTPCPLTFAKWGDIDPPVPMVAPPMNNKDESDVLLYRQTHVDNITDWVVIWSLICHLNKMLSIRHETLPTI